MRYFCCLILISIYSWGCAKPQPHQFAQHGYSAEIAYAPEPFVAIIPSQMPGRLVAITMKSKELQTREYSLTANELLFARDWQARSHMIPKLYRADGALLTISYQKDLSEPTLHVLTTHPGSATAVALPATNPYLVDFWPAGETLIAEERGSIKSGPWNEKSFEPAKVEAGAKGLVRGFWNGESYMAVFIGGSLEIYSSAPQEALLEARTMLETVQPEIDRLFSTSGKLVSGAAAQEFVALEGDSEILFIASADLLSITKNQFDSFTPGGRERTEMEKTHIAETKEKNQERGRTLNADYITVKTDVLPFDDQSVLLFDRELQRLIFVARAKSK